MNGKNRWNSLITHCLIWCMLIFSLVGVRFLTGCDQKKPTVLIGFVGPLTGRLSDLGIAGRDGVMLAVEELNAKGGLSGRRIKVLTKDDRHDPEASVKADEELADAGVQVIIGHMTSAMSKAAYPLINKRKIVMISPTTSTNELTGKDDFFIRVMPPNRSETDHLAEYAKKIGMKNMSVVYDISNASYSKEYLRNFKSWFEQRGGRITQSIIFKSGASIRFLDLAQTILHNNPDGLLIIAGALDTAMIIQQIRISSSTIPIVSSGWAMTDALIREGGRTVEGVVFSHLIDNDSKRPEYLSFKAAFKNRFDRIPGFGEMFGYEAAHVFFDAWPDAVKKGSLKTTILARRFFHGVQGDFMIDRYGDCHRKRYLITIRDGAFRSHVMQ